MIAFVIGFVLTIQTAHATIQSLGKIGGNMWEYDDESVTDNNNITGVWVFSDNQIYNIKHDKKYALFGVHILLDCVGKQYAINRIYIMGSNYHALHKAIITNPKFVDPEDDTIPERLLKWECGITG